MMRLIVTIVAMFFGLLGFTPQAEATVEMPLKVHAHTYNASSYGAPDNYTAPERGPPVKGYANTTYDAVDLRSHGTSASQSGFGLRAIYDYADAALPVQSGVVADVTNGPARVHIGEASAFGRLQVAAKAGPGAWGTAAESMSSRAAAYQARVTGGAAGSVYRVGGVKFDGFANGVLQEAKGPGYAKFVRNGQFQPWFSGADGLASQAQRQLAAAGGTPITWSVAESQAATAINNLFMSRGISGINVMYVP